MFKQKDKFTLSKRDGEKMLLSNVMIFLFLLGEKRKKQREESCEGGVIYCSDVIISWFMNYTIISVLSSKYFTVQQKKGMWRAERKKDEEGKRIMGKKGGIRDLWISKSTDVP